MKLKNLILFSLVIINTTIHAETDYTKNRFLQEIIPIKLKHSNPVDVEDHLTYSQISLLYAQLATKLSTEIFYLKNTDNKFNTLEVRKCTLIDIYKENLSFIEANKKIINDMKNIDMKLEIFNLKSQIKNVEDKLNGYDCKKP